MRRPRWFVDALLVLLLIAAAAGLLREHISGKSLFLGNYDRLGYFLPGRLAELDAIRSQGAPASWNESMFMGFDTADLPGANSPFSLLRLVSAFAPRSNFYYWAGVCVASLMALAGVAMYICLRQMALGRIAAFAGALVYMGSTHTMIRLAQSDTAGLLLAALPTGAWLVFGATPGRISRRVVVLALTTAVILLGVTGPLTIYTLGMWGSLALFQTWRIRRAAPLWVFVGGLFCALLIAAPHLRGVAADLRNYARDGGIGRSFDEIYEFFNVRPYEFLRALDDGLFGRNPAEVADLGNNLNLSEGFQIYSGTFATLCVITVLCRFRGEWFRLFKFRDGLFSFFAWLMVAVSAAILIKPIAEIVFLLFLKANLIHARLSLLGALAAAVLVALAIQKCVELAARCRPRPWLAGLAAITAGFILFGLQGVALTSPTPAKLDLHRPLGENLGSLRRMLVGDDSLAAPSAVRACRIAPRTIRLAWQHAGRSAESFEISMRRGNGSFIVVGRTTERHYDIGDTDPNDAYWFSLRAQSSTLVSPASQPVRADAYDALSGPTSTIREHTPPVWILSNRLLALLASQVVFVIVAASCMRATTWGAWSAHVLVWLVLLQVASETDRQWNDEANKTYPKPFAKGNIFIAPPGVLQSTDDERTGNLHARLEPNKYRTVFIAPPEQFMHFVSPHLSSYWKLRTVEGYLSGVPSRLAALPWAEGNLGFRQISFSSAQQLPWDLLGRLNVRQAVVVKPSLYFDPTIGPGFSSPDSVEVLLNPAPVLPREFFVTRGIPTPPPSNGSRVSLETMAAAPAAVTVEGLEAEREWPSQGTIEAKYQGGRVSLRLSPFSQPRFLVLNELYHPRWTARAGEIPLRVYAVNTVMRGVEVPAGVTTLEMEFIPYSRFPGWWLFPMAGLLLLGAIGLLPLRPRLESAAEDGPVVSMRRLFTKAANRLRDLRLLRWLGVGLAATGLNLGLLYLFVSILGVPFFIAPVFSAEIGIVLRFLANDRWVFGHPRPTWRRLGEYHIAVAGGFIVWWAASNFLVFLGVHYLLAAVLAIGGSIGFNLASNFCWIWRGHHSQTHHNRLQPR